MVIKTNKDLTKAIKALVDYNYSDEQRDYQKQEGEGRKHHIFRTIRALDIWLGEEETVS